MSDELRQLKDQAAAWAEKGKVGPALEAYEKLSKLEPTNPRWPQKAGELHKKLGHTGNAVAALAEAASRYASDGFLVKGIALCKVILGLDPRHEETQAMLARLYAASARPSAAAGSKPGASATDAAGAAAAGDARRRTIPPGASLDAVVLNQVVPGARPHRLSEDGGQVYEIPLDEPFDVLPGTQPAVGQRPPPSPRPRIGKPIPLFSSFDEDALKALILKVNVRAFFPGEKILTQGDNGDSLFVLVEGEVVVYHEGQPRVVVNRLVDGAFFGEIGLLTDARRTATVEAVAATSVLEITREVISELVDDHPEVLKVLLRFFRARILESLIATSELFARFSREEARELAARFAFIEAEPGTEMVRAGDVAERLYVLVCGVLDEGGVRLGPGAVVGERSLLLGEPARVSVVTSSKCWLLALERPALQQLVAAYPQVGAHFNDLAGAR